MKRMSLWIAVFLLIAVLVSAQEIKRPVFFLRYDGGVGFEELDSEEGEEAEQTIDSQRHKVTFRIKEQWSAGFTTNIYTAVSWKQYYHQSGDYTYFYLNPNYVWDISDRLRWRSEFRSKWTWYHDSGNQQNAPDLTSLLAKTEFTFKVMDHLNFIPSLRSEFDLYQDPVKSQQTYTASLRLESKINPEVHLSSRYRGIVRAPLGDGSEVSNRFNNEFGINLSWDPNK